MAGDSAQKEIDEPAGKFLRAQSDTVYFELLAYLSRANEIPSAVSRQSASFDRGGNGGLAESARASGLSERNSSH
jgi:hypothetical protein